MTAKNKQKRRTNKSEEQEQTKAKNKNKQKRNEGILRLRQAQGQNDNPYFSIAIVKIHKFRHSSLHNRASEVHDGAIDIKPVKTS
jgi:hypothetical protein